MSLFKAIPVLPCKSIGKTIDFYTAKLGFTSKLSGHFAVLKKDAVEIHFYLVKDILTFQPANCFIISDNVMDIYNSSIAKDLVYPHGQLTDLNYGKKEFSITDNNGNIIRFGEQP
mgnify:CR=1 FL=1